MTEEGVAFPKQVAKKTLLFSLSLLAPVLEYGRLWFLDEVRGKKLPRQKEFTRRKWLAVGDFLTK